MIGQTISHYHITSLLGQGGMGVVYQAIDESLGRMVALKFLPQHLSADSDAKVRFIQEAKAASSLDHQNICTIHEIGETGDGSVFIAMACYEGTTIREKIAQGALSVDEAVEYAIQITDGLSRAHEAGIVHRDIKPGNLMVTDRNIVKILDFGLAKVTDVSLTATGKRYGTIRYMSPEQSRGERVDSRTDVWSVGTVLYEMLSGIRPFDAPYESAILYAIINVDPVPLREHVPDIPRPLEDIVLRCLEKEPERRYQLIADLAADLRLLQRGAETVAATDYRARSARQRMLRRVSMIGLALLTAVVLVFAIPPLRYTLLSRSESVPDLRGLAVVPFLDVGENPENRAMIDGLVHFVSAKLQGLERFQDALWVVPSPDVVRFGVETVEEAATRLHVQMVVTGSVWLRGNDVQMTLYLVDSSSGRTLRSTVLNGKLSDVSAMQDGFIDALVELLEVVINPDAKNTLIAGGTTNQEAFENYLRGQGYLQHPETPSNLDLAITFFERAVAEDSTYALAMAGLGRAYWYKYDSTKDREWFDRAVEYVENAMQLDDSPAPVHVAFGTILNNTGRPAEAEQEFRRALEIDKFSAIANDGLAYSLELQNKLEDAEEDYLAAINAKPEYCVYYNHLGIFYHRETRHAEAAEQFRRVTELAPHSAWGYNNLATQYERIERAAEAESLYVKATEVNPEEYSAIAWAYNNLGILRYAADDFEAATGYFDQSLMLDSTRISAWNNLGDSYHWLRRYEEAMRAWQKAVVLSDQILGINQRSLDTLELLAMTYAKMDADEEALAVIDRILELERIESVTLLRIGKAYEIMGDREAALSYISQALHRGQSLADVENSVWLDNLRQDPRFTELIGSLSNL